MWRRVPCEQPLHTGQSILSPRRNPMLMNAGCHITIKKIFFLLVLAYAFAYLLSWDCSPVKRERELGNNCTYTDALRGQYLFPPHVSTVLACYCFLPSVVRVFYVAFA